MDNAQKAIMIGVGLFITIIIISAVLLITNLGTGLISNAQTQLSGISQSLQNQVTQAYDGKTMSGSEVIAACQQYQNSDNLSVRIVVSESVQYQTGKYAVKLLSTDIDEYKAATAGGKEVTVPTGTSYVELTDSTRTSLADMQKTGGVSGTQTYNSYVMRDSESDTVMGVLFVRKGINSDLDTDVLTY